jgi:hypothetical protein
MTRPPPYGEGVPSTSWSRIFTVTGRLLQPVWVAADVPTIRDEMIDRLLRAIVESTDLAKEASGKAEKGQGAVSTKAHSCRLVAYVAYVPDWVRENVEFS